MVQVLNYLVIFTNFLKSHYIEETFLVFGYNAEMHHLILTFTFLKFIFKRCTAQEDKKKKGEKLKCHFCIWFSV